MQNTVAIVRYFELSVMIAKISAPAFEKIAKNVSLWDSPVGRKELLKLPQSAILPSLNV